MIYRLEIANRPNVRDVMGDDLREKIASYFSMTVEKIITHRIFKIKSNINLSSSELEMIRNEFTDPVIEDSSYDKIDVGNIDYIVIVGFKPGVTDNVARSAQFAIADILGKNIEDFGIFTETIYFFQASRLSVDNIKHIAYDLIANELIQNIRIYHSDEYYLLKRDSYIPEIKSSHIPEYRYIDINISDEKLMEISKQRFLSLSLKELLRIKKYYNDQEVIGKRKKYGLKSDPTDVELECLAQTWSEHCKHKIFNARIDYTDEQGAAHRIDSLFNSFIKRTTEELNKECDYLVSVFHDNAGVIGYNDHFNLVYKVETHNTPSALDPYGGAMTGIVGVNRDPAGTGLGSDLLINTWGYCFADPGYQGSLPSGILHPRRIRAGVHQGVIEGGNQSGIPYGRGWELFDNRFLGKPLVFCGTIGLLPVIIGKNKGHVKSIKAGDKIVMVGGRIGKDGIHGATFSSEELHEESPAQAVQIGDPITQKMMTDFLLEARNQSLYTAITDNGAGGLSSSVGEMSQMSGGCEMDLSLAPLKYEGLDPWEILISEAQERMTLAVTPANLDRLSELAQKRDVELTVLGEFTDSGYFHVCYGNKTVGLLKMDFLHNGLPQMELTAKWTKRKHQDPELPPENEIEQYCADFLKRLNMQSKEKFMRHYDHEVKGLSIIKPLMGINKDVPAEATVFLAELGLWGGIVLSEGINPYLSDFDTCYMTEWCIDLAIRRVLSVGGDVSNLAGLDNFCWPDPVQSKKTPDGEYKLAQLVRANQALYCCTKEFKIPLISGKDSMKNDAIIAGKKISIPPTLLFSLIGKITDVRRTHSLQAKSVGDLLYIIGLSNGKLAGSEFCRMLSENKKGSELAEFNLEKAKELYQVIRILNKEQLIESAAAPGLGGLFFALFLTAYSSGLGIRADLTDLPCIHVNNFYQILFNESSARMVVSIKAENQKKVDRILNETPYLLVGEMIKENKVEIIYKDQTISMDTGTLASMWRGNVKT
jgi:phosphoribosylformylglycinamidine synthase II